MTAKFLLHMGMIACLVATGTGSSLAQSLQPIQSQDMAQAYEQGWDRNCDDIGNRRERMRCLNAPTKSPKSDDWGTAVGVGIIGLTLGAIIAGAASSAEKSKPRPVSDYDRWLAYCHSKHRSFDPDSGTFIGRDGRRQRCR